MTAALSGLRSPRIATVSRRLPQAKQTPILREEILDKKVEGEGDGGAGDA
jgi:hypothetical protein